MKSFRLDTDSIKEFIVGLPVLIAIAALFGTYAYLGVSHEVWRATFIVTGAIYLGCVFQGLLKQNLQTKYPNASYVGLLSVGLFSILVGVSVRMLFPLFQGGWIDYTWIAVSFTSILAFVLINRRDPDVMR